MDNNNNQDALQGQDDKKTTNTKRSLRRGRYFTAVILVSIAIVVLINVVIAQIPTSATQFDMSDSKIYSISDTSIDYISDLTDDIEFILLDETANIDARVLKFIENYAALSDHITYRQIDPTTNPSALGEYGVESGHLVVINTATQKQTSVALTNMITYDEDRLYYYNQYYETGFDAEGQITSSVNYVTSENSSLLYFMQGHGETGLADTLIDSISKLNLSTAYVNLLESGSVPEDCTVLICNTPTSDLSDDELSMLQDYMSKGGQVMLIYPASEENYANWQLLLGDYGLEMADGFVGDLTNYYTSLKSYYAFFPELNPSSSITSGIDSGGRLALIINTRGLLQRETDRAVTIDSFMTTSPSGFLDSDAENTGTYIVGAAVTDETESGTARLAVFGSQYLIDSEVLSKYSNLANADIFLNSITDGIEDFTNISIPEKSLAVYANTVTNPQLWGIMFVVVIPVLLLGGGLFFWVRRRRQ